MTDYQATFDSRGAAYNAAAIIAPRARHAERQRIIDLLDLEPTHTVLDAPAGGGYLADGITPLVPYGRVVCLEPSQVFAEGIDPKIDRHVSPLTDMPLKAASVDRVASLAGVHHLTTADKARFVAETYRVIRPGGRVVIADVLAGTPVASFLNGPIDRFTATGHRGVFIRRRELWHMLSHAGFSNVREEVCRVDWKFSSRDQMLAFCYSLFGITKASYFQLERAIGTYLSPARDSYGLSLQWELLYAVGER